MNSSSVRTLRVASEQEPAPKIEVGRRALAYGIATVLALADIAIIALVLPPAVWAPDYLFFVLLSLSFGCLLCAVSVRSTSSCEPSDIAAFVALVFLGPLPAALVMAIPDIALWHGSRFRFKALVMNLVGFTTSACCGGLVLLAFGFDPPNATLTAQDTLPLFLAASAFMLGSYVSGALLELSDLSGLSGTITELRTLFLWFEFPIVIGCVALAVSYATFGPVGLVPSIPFVVAWRIAFSRKAGPDRNQSRAQACAACAAGIADALELGRRQKQLVRDTALHVSGESALSSLRNFPQIMNTALYATEHFDGGGSGSPGLAKGDLIPIEARVLAVAQEWTDLAYPNGSFADEQAIASLRSRAGTQFDPLVVAAAEVALYHGAIFIGPRGRMLESWPAPSRATSSA